MDVLQFRNEIVEPILVQANPGWAEPNAINLLMVTAACESYCHQYAKQIDGPALGAFMMEPATMYDIFDVVLQLEKNLKDLPPTLKRWRQMFEKWFKEEPTPDELKFNIRLQTIMARLHYARHKEELPGAQDLAGLINYYLKYWAPNPNKTSFSRCEKICLKLLGNDILY